MSALASPRVFDAPLSLDEFQSPPAHFGIAPFWFWNGDMEPKRIREQVRAMKEAHLGGFFIHPRQGLQVPYLSTEFFNRVRIAVEEAADQGLEAWLYDEFPYPSGIAGGALTANHPELRARVLEPYTREARSGESVRWELPLGRVVCALAVPLRGGAPQWDAAVDIREHLGVVLSRDELWIWPMGHIPYNEKRYMADEGVLVLDWTAPAGSEWRLVAGIEREQRGHKYFDVWFDPLHPDAAPRFLELTHERYAQHVGQWFGTTIPGIFTDEIEPPHWSPQLQNSFSWDWSRIAPFLWDSSFPNAKTLRSRWRAKALELFRERWEQPIATWCRQHHLIWCAEKPTYRPSQMDGIAQPSTDAAHRRVDLGPEPLPLDLRANARVAMSSAEQNGSEEVRCECFHSLGWGATLQDLKWSLDWMGATGVNRFTPHAFYYSSAGLRKHDAAPSFFEENPYWEHFHLLSDYGSRLGMALSRGREVAGIALLYPTQRLWERDKGDEDGFVELMNALLKAHLGFHVVDANALNQSHIKDGIWRVGRACYDTLLVPPFDPDEEVEAVLAAAWQGGMRVIFSTDIAEALAELETTRTLSVHDENGQQLSGVWSLWRQTPAEDATPTQNLVFLANTTADPVTATVRVHCDAPRWEQWSLESGAATTIKNTSEFADEAELRVELPAFGSALLIGQRGVGAAVPAVPKRTLTLDIEGDWEVRLDEPNALRLDRWQLAPESLVGNAQSAIYDDAQWRHIEALPLFYRDKRVNRDVELLPRPTGTVWYRCVVESETHPPKIALRVEDDAIGGSWRAWLNGEELGRNTIAPNFLHGHNQTEYNLAQFWREGSNVLFIRVEEGASHAARGGIRTPLHLVGDFGVRTTGDGTRVLTAPVAQSHFNDLDGAGLPHFAGTVRYSKTFPLSTFTSFDFNTLTLPVMWEEVVGVRINGTDLGARAWSPYEWTLPSLNVDGSNEIEVEIAVTHTLLRFLEGRVWNARTGEKRIV